ncbi:hypothetical protein E2562_025551, partial [Oryza meyeriana var. granulata]
MVSCLIHCSRTDAVEMEGFSTNIGSISKQPTAIITMRSSCAVKMPVEREFGSGCKGVVYDPKIIRLKDGWCPEVTGQGWSDVTPLMLRPRYCRAHM